jgi:hypothetical protein
VVPNLVFFLRSCIIASNSSAKSPTSSAQKGLVDHFLNIWDGGPDKQEALHMAEKMTDMIDATTRTGLRPVGIEPPVEHFFQENEGVSHFHHGLERLSRFDQDAFNKYFDPHADAAKLAANKQALLNALKHSGWSPDATAKFGRILDQMKEADPPLDLAGLKLPRSAHRDKKYDDKLDQWRNENWMNVIQKQVDDGKQVAVFAGGAHFGYDTTDENISKLLDNSGIKSITLMKTGGDLAKIKHEREAESKALGFKFQPLPPEVHALAGQDAGVGDKLFAYKFAPGHPREADYVVHLPDERP